MGLIVFQIPDLVPLRAHSLDHAVVESVHNVTYLLREIAKSFTH